MPPVNARDAGDDDVSDHARLIVGFEAAMAASGPFEAAPRVAVAVSGGADSTALALLADDWVRARGGYVLALVVDHALRPASGAEAALTVSRFAERNLAARLLTIAGLAKGPALAARARDARYKILTDACAEAGIVHLLLGHHASDQAETTMIRTLGGSGDRGLAGMAGVAESGALRILRPLLKMPPAWLRGFLIDRGVPWVEDPSNRDPTASRVRIRQLRGDPNGEGHGTRALIGAARTAGLARSRRDHDVANILALRAVIRPEGFALLTRGPIAPEALAALVRTVGGTSFAPPIDQIAAQAANLKSGTIGGVRVMPAGRMGDGWLLVREDRAIASPIPALNGALWDGRFRFWTDHPLPDGTTLAALGDAASGIRAYSNLPAAVLCVMPALWRRNILADVPHLLYREPRGAWPEYRVVFEPPQPLAGAPFYPA